MGNECYKTYRYKTYNTPISLISNTNMIFRNFICTYSQKLNYYKPYRNYKMTMPESPDIPILSPITPTLIFLNNSPVLSPVNNSWTVSCPTVEIAIGGSLNNSPKNTLVPISMDNYIMNNYIKGYSPTRSDLSDLSDISNVSDFIVI